MKFVKAAFVVALAVTTAGAFTSRADAAPPPTNVAAMKAARWTHQSCKYAMAAGTEAGAIEVGAAMAAGVIEAGVTGAWAQSVAARSQVRPTTALIPITEEAMPTVEAMLMIIVLPMVTRGVIPATARGIIMGMVISDRPARSLETDSESTRRARSAAVLRARRHHTGPCDPGGTM